MNENLIYILITCSALLLFFAYGALVICIFQNIMLKRKIRQLQKILLDHNIDTTDVNI